MLEIIWRRIWRLHRAIITTDTIMEDMETDTGIMVMDTMDTGTMDTMTMVMATIIMAMDITMVTMDMEDIIIMDTDIISI